MYFLNVHIIHDRLQSQLAPLDIFFLLPNPSDILHYIMPTGGLSVLGSIHTPGVYCGGAWLMVMDSRSGILVIGFESASTGNGFILRTSVPGNSYGSSCMGISCAQLDRVAPVSSLVDGCDNVDSAPIVPEPVSAPIVLIPAPYGPNAVDEAIADIGDGHHEPIVPIPCETGDGAWFAEYVPAERLS